MIRVPPLPEAKKINCITPTSYETFKTCYLRGIIESNINFKKFIYFHPKTILGIVSHEIISDIYSNNLNEVLGNDFNSIVNTIKEIFKNKCQFYANQSKENPFILKSNDVENWPGYNMRLTRLIRFIQKNVNTNGKKQQTLKNKGGIEKTYEVFNGKLKGKPDRIRKSNDHEIIIEDYKTGQILEAGSLKPHIRRQMLLYSFICQEAFKVSKIRSIVIPLFGQPYEEEVDLLEAKSIANDAITILNDVNRQIEEVNSGLKSLLDLATPSKNACRYCSFKFVCGRFWGNHELRLSKDSFNVEGKVLGYKQYGKFTNIYIDCNLSKIVILKNINEIAGSLLGETIKLIDLQLEDNDDLYFIAVPTYRTIGFKL
ncbi:PD-(D/E)XK nuclease family protein [Priestia megaterium]|uniref:PD-(D/E)XK nuclease family protein n=1 Tax=Priestia megaterium TaxID=1404 RepID=UPI00203E9B48|nr:PD-(D/E)XK nuclease family protein [Priestia megaterium]MCM3195815.1 PD-(D/E)XK nuclease family protein [Priestia megaterium]